MKRKKTVLIIGINGFVGHHLLRHILRETQWRVIGVDIADDKVQPYLESNRFTFYKRDMTKAAEFIEQLVKESDVVVPLAGIATPQYYITEPIRVFELDFEANLAIVRFCVTHKKRVIWPSTSEVYGMSPDKEFHPYTSNLVLGPIDKFRWIYSASKQLMDRIIFAYGRDHELDFTIFRPFNWIGVGLDDLHANTAPPRVTTQFLGNILRGENLKLVDGGEQRRSFTYIDDSIDALLKIIENPKGIASRKIYNIGNPHNNHSIRELAEMMLKLAPSYPYFRERAGEVNIIAVPGQQHYGGGYQDMSYRVPSIANITTDLGWRPHVSMQESLKRTYEAYVEHLRKSKPGNLVKKIKVPVRK